MPINLSSSATASFGATFNTHSPQLNSIPMAFQPDSMPQGYISPKSFLAHHMPQQHLLQGPQAAVNNNNVCQTPSPPLATMLPPTLSAITPEVFFFINIFYNNKMN